MNAFREHDQDSIRFGYRCSDRLLLNGLIQPFQQPERHPRQLALMHALARFAHVAAGGTFKTADLYPATVAALGVAPERYRLASLRYDLSKLRAKGLVEKVPRSRRYRLLPEGYRLCVVFLKLFAPLTAGLLQPLRGDARIKDANGTNWIASISGSSMISNGSRGPLGSKGPHDVLHTRVCPVSPTQNSNSQLTTRT